MRRGFVNLPDQDLAYLPEGTEHFDEYVDAVHWAHEYARINRELMMAALIDGIRAAGKLPAFEARSIEALERFVRRGLRAATTGARVCLRGTRSRKRTRGSEVVNVTT